MKILFRCDAGFTRGSGHLVRCLTLADALAKHGVEITFICREDAGPFLDLFKDRNFNLLTLPAAPDANNAATEEIWTLQQQQEDYELCQKACSGQKFDWVIVDHYALSAPWEKLANNLGHKIFVIDDLANRPHDCDVLLDQNEYADKADRYDALLPARCLKLLGGKFVLLREEFSLARVRIRKTAPYVKNILILMGGSDYRGQTLRLVKILGGIDSKEPLQIHAVIGQKNAQRAELEALAFNNHSLHLHFNHANISSLMLDADIAFGAGGTATWEFCCLGNPLLMISFAQNQIKMAKDAEASGFAEYIGHFDDITDDEIKNRFEKLSADQSARETMHAIGQSIVDGKGTKRIVNAIISADQTISLRPVNQEDSKDLFEWRNDDVTREMSIQTDPVAFDDHRHWFEQSISRQDRILLMAETEAHKLGVVRFDLSATGTATISINLNPVWRGRGLANEMLLKAEKYLPPHFHAIHAEIKTVNKASVRTFEHAGYIIDRTVDGLSHYIKHLHS